MFGLCVFDCIHDSFIVRDNLFDHFDLFIYLFTYKKRIIRIKQLSNLLQIKSDKINRCFFLPSALHLLKQSNGFTRLVTNCCFHLVNM